MLRSDTVRRSAFGRLLMAAAFLAALFAASPGHVHSSASAEAACAVCTFHDQTPSLEPGSPEAGYALGREADVPSLPEAGGAAGFEHPSRSRAPPLFS